MSTTTSIFASTTDGIKANGTSLQGYLTTTFDQLVELFGDPNRCSGDGKTTASWTIVFQDGTVATIYDWKVESTPTNEYTWHIGGNSSKAVDYIKDATSGINAVTDKI